ncbi:MAG: AAA family ATPase [Pseudomonadota bacterium]|nr:AAA family ATPase [Pseudomonadota bacterium]
MYSKRANQAHIEHSFEKPAVTAIIGPRRVGKTSLVDHYIEQHTHRRWVLLNMDDMQQRLRIERGELGLMIAENAKQVIGGADKIWVKVDEAQKAPEIFDQIKILYDDYTKKLNQNKIKFILTGSGHLDLHQLSAESLAGRIEIFNLFEFSIREGAIISEPQIPYDSLFDIIEKSFSLDDLTQHIKTILPFKPQLEIQLDLHLIWSGLPEVLECANERDRVTYLNNYIQTYFEKDIRSIETIADLNLYRRMMEVLAEQTGSVRDESRHIQSIGCARDTLKKYRGFLEATLYYEEIYPYITNTMQRIVKSPKGYLTNNGLISILTGLHDLNTLEKSSLIGHRLENWFLTELHVWLARSVYRSNIYYWRLPTGVEVDFIIEKKPAIYPFEVTYATRVRNEKVNNLLKFMHQEPKAQWGFYIYRGDFKIDEKTRIIYIPAWAIA